MKQALVSVFRAIAGRAVAPAVKNSDVQVLNREQLKSVAGGVMETMGPKGTW